MLLFFYMFGGSSSLRPLPLAPSPNGAAKPPKRSGYKLRQTWRLFEIGIFDIIVLTMSASASNDSIAVEQPSHATQAILASLPAFPSAQPHAPPWPPPCPCCSCPCSSCLRELKNSTEVATASCRLMMSTFHRMPHHPRRLHQLATSYSESSYWPRPKKRRPLRKLSTTPTLDTCTMSPQEYYSGSNVSLILSQNTLVTPT